MLLLIISSLVAVVLLSAVPMAHGVTDADRTRIEQIAPLLPDGPFSLGRPIDDRAAWAAAARHPAMTDIVARAEKKMSEPVPAMTFEIYGQYSRTGERTKEYGAVRYARHERVAIYTLAECVENKGRFLKPLEAIIADVCDEPTWLYNFHDRELNGWNRKGTWIDLGVVVPASDLSHALVLLGDRLRPESRQRIRDECRVRVIEPYRVMIDSQPGSWAYSEMNWNAVCHAGVVVTALATLEDRRERAYFVAMAEKLSVNYLRGFGPDGYCGEGTGYWNYGFSNFAQMSELILQATKGRVNLFDLPGAKRVAIYPTRIEIMDGLSPSFADCVLSPQPDGNLYNFLNGHYALGLPPRSADPIIMRLLPTLTYVFPSSGDKPQQPAAAATGLRDYFDHGGVLVSRPARGSACRMGVSLKGGHNNEDHNHNDLGTFVVAVGKQLLILDPGLETYSARTFSKDRYQGALLNSYGHPVPVVAGQLQRTGADARATILKADFTDARDVFAMDLRSAYDVPSLQTLTRTFAYDRTGDGVLTVEDRFAFASPQSFSSALITYGQWKQTGPRSLVIEQGNDGVEVTIESSGEAIEITAEVVETQTPSGAKPTRIAIKPTQPATRGTLSLRIVPRAAAK